MGDKHSVLRYWMESTGLIESISQTVHINYLRQTMTPAGKRAHGCIIASSLLRVHLGLLRGLHLGLHLGPSLVLVLS